MKVLINYKKNIQLILTNNRKPKKTNKKKEQVVFYNMFSYEQIFFKKIYVYNNIPSKYKT